MKTFLSLTLLVLACTLLSGGCRTAPVTAPSLRVGISPNAPPVAYRQGDRLVGIEADLACKLGGSLARPVEFVELAWDDLIPALLDGRIDVIMSGMNATDARKVRIAFSEPYMSNSLVAVMNRGDVASYPTKESILGSSKTVGVLKGSSAESFVAKSMPQAARLPIDKVSDAKTFFVFNRINLYIGDIFASAWLISENETILGGQWFPLYQEPVAWAFRKEDEALRAQVNAALAGWKKDGSLKGIMARHVPFLDRVPWEAP